MKNKKATFTLNKWHFKLGFIPVYWIERGVMLHFGVFKLVSFPQEGMPISKENYEGFWFRKEFTFNGWEISF